MSRRRPVGTGRRFGYSGSFFPFSGSSHSKSKSSPLLSIALILVVYNFARYYSLSRLVIARSHLFVILGAVVLIGIAKGGSGDFLCTLEVQRAIPVLKKAHGDSMRKVLHVGPETCSVVSKLVKEDETEAWGVEPHDIEDADANCKGLVRKRFLRVADIKFPLPNRPKSFSLVIVSDALDYLSPKCLNKTLPDLARVSADGLVAFSGLPGRQKAKVAKVSKFGRPAKLRSSAWWVKYFMQMSLEEYEAAAKKFEQAALKMSNGPSCQVFHLKSYH